MVSRIGKVCNVDGRQKRGSVEGGHTNKRPSYLKYLQPLFVQEQMAGSAKATCDIIFCQLVERVGKHLFSCSDFNEVTKVEVGCSL